jgi:ferredoxin-NADP reductase
VMAVVVERTPAALGVLRLTLEAADGGPLPEWEAGAHLDVVLRSDLVRQYSLCGDPADRSRWEVAVLREASGRGGSAYVHDRLAVGDAVRVRGPRNHFRLEQSPGYLFIAGGIGVTPLLPMLGVASARGATWRLVYGGRSIESMAFVREVTTSFPGKVDLVPEDEMGLIDLDALLGVPSPGTLVYCCGPESLLAAVTQRMSTWPAGSLHVERFSAAATHAASQQSLDSRSNFEVELARSGKVLAVGPRQSVLEAVESAGVAVLSSCREGTCGTCETVVIEGLPDHRDSLLSAAERAANDCMMICISRSFSPRLVLEL